jgi:hypothetical protein
MTWKETVAGLPEGLPSEALELLRRYTVPQRHAWRVQQAAIAALQEANKILQGIEHPVPEGDMMSLARGEWRRGDNHIAPVHARIAATLCELEEVGTGGRLGILATPQSRATLRAEWARGLGKGRANASDGPAWTSAIRAAGVLLRDGLTAAEGIPRPDEDQFIRDLGLIDSPQSRAEAGRQMLAAFDRGEMDRVRKYADVLVEAAIAA